MNRKYLFSHGAMNFYDGDVYRCSHWMESDFSKWKIVDNKFYYEHQRGALGWTHSESTGAAEIRHIEQKHEEAILSMMETIFKLET